MRVAMILMLLVLSAMHPEASTAQAPCLPPGVSPEFLSWPSEKVIPKTAADALPGETLMYRDPLSRARIMTVTVDGVTMILDPAPDAPVIDFWVRVIRPTTSPCVWQRSRERAA